MGIYKKVYDFAAKAGSLEGYVYPREKVDVNYLPRWSDNLVEQYRGLPPEVREEFQSLCDQTLGRTIQSKTGYINVSASFYQEAQLRVQVKAQ